MDGCDLGDLSINFTLPGHPSVEMKKGGKEEWLGVHNVEEYVKVGEWVDG